MPRILTINDDESLRDSLRRTLRSKGYVVMEATEDSEGIKVIDNYAIDVAIVDLFMPRKEGLETLITLRRSNPTLRVIAMSGGGVRGKPNELLMGRCQTLAKPFTRHELIEPVDSRASIDLVTT